MRAASTKPRCSWGRKAPKRFGQARGRFDEGQHSKSSGDRDLQIGRIYLTGMIAAVPVAVVAIFAAAPTAAPAPLSLDAAGQSAVLVEVAPPLSPCRFAGGETPGRRLPGSKQKEANAQF